MGSFCFRRIPTHSAGKTLTKHTNAAVIPVWATDRLHNNLLLYSSSSVHIWTHLQSHKKTQSIYTCKATCQMANSLLLAACRGSSHIPRRHVTWMSCFSFLCASRVNRRAVGSCSGRTGRGWVRRAAAGRCLVRCSGRTDTWAAYRWWDTVTCCPPADRRSSGSHLERPDETSPEQSKLTLPVRTRDLFVSRQLEVGLCNI